jgi:hypothetical protein
MKKLNFIDWLRKQDFKDTTKKTLISKHVSKVQKYADPIKLATGDQKDITVARIFSSLSKLPPEEKEEKESELTQQQQQLLNAVTKKQ